MTRDFIVKELINKKKYEHKGEPLLSYFEVETINSYSSEDLLEAAKKFTNNVLINECLVAQIAQICSQFFFGFEALCKCFLASSCFKFITRILNNQIIQHSDVWKTLKMLGGDKNQTDCQICRLRDYCVFEYPFRSFANLYSFIIKIRMISDYTEILHYDKRFSDFIKIDYANDILPVLVSLDKQIIQIHKGFIFYPINIKSQFQALKDLLSDFQ